MSNFFFEGFLYVFELVWTMRLVLSLTMLLTETLFSDDTQATGGAAGDQTQQNLQQIQYCGATGTLLHCHIK